MGFKKIRFGTEEIISLVIEDIDGKIISKWKVHKSDFPSVMKIISRQLGLNIRIIDRKRDSDLDWIK